MKPDWVAIKKENTDTMYYGNILQRVFKINKCLHNVCMHKLVWK